MSTPASFLRSTLFLVLSFFVLSCEEPYTPEILEEPVNLLVVSGYINSNGPTTILLSRTQSLADEAGPDMVRNASVAVEEENGARYQLQETKTGTYTSNRLPLNVAKRHRLVIKTNGKEYASDYVEVKQTPAIDNVSWKVENDGVQIYVSSHDPKNSTRYYRWNFEETWEYTPPYFSSLEYVNHKIQNRSAENDIYLCWRFNNSASIYLGSTTRLSQDIVSNYPLHKLPANSEKIKRKYSVLVKQYAQSKEAYDYYEILRKNTESIGSLFDPLPTQLTGNILCLTDPSEIVIGFIQITSEETKRIFINKTELPLEWQPPRMACQLDTVERGNEAAAFADGAYIPVSPIYQPNSDVIIGYTATSKPCADCRVFGTKTKPDYWQ